MSAISLWWAYMKLWAQIFTEYQILAIFGFHFHVNHLNICIILVCHDHNSLCGKNFKSILATVDFYLESNEERQNPVKMKVSLLTQAS